MAEPVRSIFTYTEPPLFEPDWIKITLTLHVMRSLDQISGGVMVEDGDSEQLLLLTAESFGYGHDGLTGVLEQMALTAAAHLEPGEPFPA
jgi:hypothetical protein